jgi:dipeptidyl aminopeptidase/acylaminoacyl peptidase
VRPEDVALLSAPTGLTLHRDLLLVAVATPDPVANRYSGGIHAVALDGSGTRQWTRGEHDTDPVLSPDGRWLAFLRAPGGDGALGKPQLHLLPVDGGEARRLTELPLGAGVPVWSPDSAQLAFTARVPEPGRYGTATEDGDDESGVPGPDAEAPRLITRQDYYFDNVGFTRDKLSRLFVVDALDEAAEPVQLTDGRCEISHPAWTPDGTHLVVVAPRDLGAEETLHDDLYAVAADGSGEPVLVAHCPGEAERPVVTGDGVVVFLGREFEGRDESARNSGLWAVLFRLDAPGTPRRLTDAETVDVHGAPGAPVHVSGAVLAVVLNRGAMELRRIPLDAEGATLDELPLVLGDRAAVAAFAVDADTTAAIVSTPDSPGEVVVLRDGEPRTLTAFAEPLRAAGLRPVDEITATAPDGYPVHGWLVTPEGEGPHPLLLCVHGGPFALYGYGFFDEAQVYAAAGYAVLLANPRGSASYGQAHGRAILHALGTVDADDLLALLDAALERPDTDRDRVGVMGGSYGGFMTGWLASHHGERFVAAWSERAVNAWDSFSGSSDIGWFFTDNYVGADLAEQRERSPLYHAEKITIPFKVVHSEHDWRVPVEQGQRMYIALRRQGTPTEFLLFPGEGHELSRSGQPRHRVQRFDAVLDWWARHLPVT